MADPLSVAASVAGLLAVAAKVINSFTRVAKRIDHAPKNCELARNEVVETRMILAKLESFITGTVEPSVSGAALVTVEDLAVSLVSCVTTFAELDRFSNLFDNAQRTGFTTRLRFISAEKELADIIRRLQLHKSSLTLILSILSCQMQSDAKDQADRLSRISDQILRENKTLKRRLAAGSIWFASSRSPSYIEAASILGEDNMSAVICDNLSIAEQLDSAVNKQSTEESEIISIEPSEAKRPGLRTDFRSPAFEQLLTSSWVYRRASTNDRDSNSLGSRTTYTASWSILSGISLSQISNIAVLKLPIYIKDIKISQVMGSAYSQENVPFEWSSIGLNALDDSDDFPRLRALHYASHPRQAIRPTKDSKETWSEDAEIKAAQSSLGIRLAANRAKYDAFFRTSFNDPIGDLANDLDAGALRELMERARRMESSELPTIYSRKEKALWMRMNTS